MKKLLPKRTTSPLEGPALRPEEFRLLKELIHGRTGHAFGDEHLREFERRLRPRLAAGGFDSFAEYHRHLKLLNDADEELQTVFDLITNNETYFFREDYQLQSFRDETLPRLEEIASKRKHLTCWSMGCSTGEEAYSVAVVLLESKRFDGWNLKVFGTDLSRRRVAFARQGIYGESSFRRTSAERRHSYFVTTRKGVRVASSVRSICQFGQLNLLDLHRRSTIDQVDAIFCRNVLIYFEPEAKKRAIQAIYERIRPGGYLMLGHSESLLNNPDPFEPVHLTHDVVYHRPLDGPNASRGTGRGL